MKIEFGTDGIRGQAGVFPLTCEGAEQIGRAVGTHFAKPGDLICIGQDTRESSPWISASLTAGILATGVHVEMLDIIPTPGLSFLTRRGDARAGVMITASHNPSSDNGIKIFDQDGGKLSDATQDALTELINLPNISRRGSGRAFDGVNKKKYYVNHLVDASQIELDGLTIAIDTAHGATTKTAQQVFMRLGAQVVPLFNQPDGRNINDGCGATDTAVLQKIVKDQGLNMGAAFDGDGDRVMLVDARGRVLDGDDILHVNAVQQRIKEVVATIMSNLGLEKTLSARGITLHRTNVGDRFVLEELEKRGLTLGGEQSGHIIFRDKMPTGDGILATLQTIGNVARSGISLGEWHDALPRVPQQIVNIAVPDKRTATQHPDVLQIIADTERELGSDGFINVRPSGTEDIVRITVQAPGASEIAEAIANQIQLILAS